MHKQKRRDAKRFRGKAGDSNTFSDARASKFLTKFLSVNPRGVELDSKPTIMTNKTRGWGYGSKSNLNWH